MNSFLHFNKNKIIRNCAKRNEINNNIFIEGKLKA